MSKSKTLYSNNARSTLFSNITAIDTTIPVTSAASFPVIGPVGEHFFITLDNLVNVEIIKVNSVVGNSFVGCERGQEGTIARVFAATTSVENRLTAWSITRLARLTDRLADYVSIETLPNPANFAGNSALCESVDAAGTPITALINGTKWKLENYPDLIKVGAVGAGSTATTMNLTGAETFLLHQPQKTFVVQFVSGPNTGRCRFINTVNVGGIVWVTPLPNALGSGDSYEIYRCISAWKMPTGNGHDRIFFENDNIMWSNYSVPTGKNALSAGPVSINPIAVVSIPVGSVWTIV